MGLKGRFITFEGTEGSGKSTQVRRAAAYLRRKGGAVVVLREPGGTRTGEAIRRILLDRRLKMSGESELLLYLAARAEIVREKILPALRKNKIVLCDRFEDSTLAYQGFGREFSIKDIQTVSRLFVRGSLRPDLTIVLDIDPRLGMGRGGRHDRMEREPHGFHRKVRRGFLHLARRDPRRYVVIDGRLSVKAVSEQIEEVLDRVCAC